MFDDKLRAFERESVPRTIREHEFSGHSSFGLSALNPAGLIEAIVNRRAEMRPSAYVECILTARIEESS